MCWEFAEHKTQQRCNVDLRKLYRPVISEPWTVHGMGKALHDISTKLSKYHRCEAARLYKCEIDRKSVV